MKIQPLRQAESNSSRSWKREAVNTFKMTVNENNGKTSQTNWGLFSEYCKNSSIHGMKYLGQPKRTRCERIFWMVIFGISILMFVPFAHDIWVKWKWNDKFVSFTDKSIYVWEIPFPTITVCSPSISKGFNYYDVYRKAFNLKDNITFEPLTDDETILLDAALLISKKDFAKNIDGFVRLAAEDHIQALVKIMPKSNEIFHTCRWQNVEENCEELFSKIVTAAGICYSFNALSTQDILRTADVRDFVSNTQVHKLSDWNLEDGYTVNSVNEVYPRRIVQAKDGLELVLNSDSNDDYLNLSHNGPANGLMIFINTPGDVPQVTEKYISVNHGHVSKYYISPKIISPSNTLKFSSIYVRECYFQHERYLRYFKTYTQMNCELECLSNFTLRTCGCVRFSMPSHAGVPACGSHLIECMNDAEDSILRDCLCYPTCATISYQTEKVADHQKKDYKNNTNLNGKKEDSKTRIGIYFKESIYPTTKLVNLYGINDFLADCGGILSLLMGCSAISFVEIIYFLTLRLLTNLRMRFKKSKEIKNKSKFSM